MSLTELFTRTLVAIRSGTIRVTTATGETVAAAATSEAVAVTSVEEETAAEVAVEEIDTSPERLHQAVSQPLSHIRAVTTAGADCHSPSLLG